MKLVGECCLSMNVTLAEALLEKPPWPSLAFIPPVTADSTGINRGNGSISIGNPSSSVSGGWFRACFLPVSVMPDVDGDVMGVLVLRRVGVFSINIGQRSCDASNAQLLVVMLH